MAGKVETFQYEPHPRIAARASTRPPKVDDENVGFNGRLATLITKGVGNMWAFYAVALAMALWMAGLGESLFGDPYPWALMLLVFGGIMQMLLMIAIMVGQQVLGGLPTSVPFRPTRTPRRSCTSANSCRPTSRVRISS